MRLRPILLLLALAAFSVSTAQAGPATFEDALARAKAEGKLVLVDFFTEWCGPCKVFNRDSQEDADLKKTLDGFVVFKTDAEKDGKELAQTHHVGFFPTYMVFNAGGEVTDRWSGYDKDLFIEAARDAIDDPTTFDQKFARHDAAPTLKDALTLAEYFASISEFEKSIAMYRSAAKLDPGTSYAMEIFDNYYYGYRKDAFDDAQLTAAADEVFGNERVEPYDLLVAARMMNICRGESDNPDLALPYIRQAFERTEGNQDEDVTAYRKRLLPDYALQVLKDGEKATEYKKAALPEGWREDPDQLNSYAWWCFENRLNLEEAQELAIKGANLAVTGSDRAQILDTVAEICNALGDCGEALTYTNQAIEADPHREYYRKQKKRFEGILADGREAKD